MNQIFSFILIIAMKQPSYPPSPGNAPENLTKLPFSYKLKAFIAILSILLFFALYFCLLAIIAFVVKVAIIYPVENPGFYTILIKLGAVAGSVMLFIFTIKFLFKLKNVKPDNRIRIDEKKNPELVDFVHRLCSETNAPLPKRIYVDPDVNAYVSYSNTWLSLIFPVRKDLTLGLGLIGSLNLSEFKAVMAHEFGHFAQRSMKIGSYIHSANTIIHDMIFTRDSWDNILATWRSSDIRLSAAAWVITPIIWFIRELLRSFYMLLNLLHSSLSREMEFNADKVAVSITGSNEIISGLWKAEFGSAVLNSTFNHAFNASQKNIFVENIFAQFEKMIAENMEIFQSEFEKLPEDANGVKRFFPTDSTLKTSTYSSHPLHFQREDSAKKPFIEGVTDSRSPWILFSDKEVLQSAVSKIVYKTYFKKTPKEFVSDAAFSEFINIERTGAELLEEFHHTFQDRFMAVPDESWLTDASDETPVPELSVLMDDLSELMKPVEEFNLLVAEIGKVADGSSKAGYVTYKKAKYYKSEINDVYKKVMRDRDKYFSEKFPEWDKLLCKRIYLNAASAGKENEFLRLCRQHRNITQLYQKFIGLRNYFYNQLDQLNAAGNVEESTLTTVSRTIRQVIQEINKDLAEFGAEDYVALPNIENVEELKKLVVENGSIKFMTTTLFEGKNVNKFSLLLENAITQLQRIDQKSVIAMLLFNRQLN